MPLHLCETFTYSALGLVNLNPEAKCLLTVLTGEDALSVLQGDERAADPSVAIAMRQLFHRSLPMRRVVARRIHPKNVNFFIL